MECFLHLWSVLRGVVVGAKARQIDAVRDQVAVDVRGRKVDAPVDDVEHAERRREDSTRHPVDVKNVWKTQLIWGNLSGKRQLGDTESAKCLRHPVDVLGRADPSLAVVQHRPPVVVIRGGRLRFRFRCRGGLMTRLSRPIVLVVDCGSFLTVSLV